ncbi:MAG: hypothetical protein ABH886_07680 [Candidatus Desantisbacteria bacterium]
MKPEDIYDIKGVIGVVDWGTITFFLCIFLCLCLLGFFIYKWLNHWALKSRYGHEERLPEIPFDEVSLDELNSLDPLVFFEKMAFKEYYLMITGIVRKFLARNYIIDTLDKTSLEIIGEIEGKERDYEKVRMLDKYFQICDMVKFAKYKPTLTQMRENKDDSLRIVKELYRKMVRE